MNDPKANRRMILIASAIVLALFGAAVSSLVVRRSAAAPVGPLGPVTVTATAGTPGPTDYATLKAAFDAINAGTHQGAINIAISGSTTETATAALNNSGAGAAVYTSVVVRPTAVVTVTGSIAGAIIKLNGADNVTIDGRIGGTGTNRDLTVSNSSTAANSAAVWLSSLGAGNGASNNVIRNLELACGATQNTGTVVTFGIVMTGATIGISVDGNDNDNNSFIANRIIRSRYGILTRGVATNLNASPSITDNIIGPAAFGPDQIGKTGILMQFDTGANITRNTIQFVGGEFANTTAGTDRIGIGLGVESWGSAPTTLAGANYSVTRNVIHDVVEERTFSAVGVLLSVVNGASPTNNLVANNFIYNVKANGTAGDTGAGIGIGAGNGDRVVFNSVRMSGDLDPNASAAAPTQTSVNLRIANTPTNLTVKNNSLYNDVFSSTAPALLSVNIQVQSATFNFGTGGLNNNTYFFPAGNTTARTGAIGTSSLATTFFATLANWQAAITPPQDQLSIQADPQYVSATDLHIALASPNVNAGATGTGVVNDIDAQLRDATPDIGADEPNGTTPPANDIAASTILVPSNGSTVLVGGTTTPQASFTNVGSATQTNVGVRFTITGPGGFSYLDNKVISSIAPEETVNVTFAASSTFTTTGAYTTTALVTTADANAGNDSVSGGFTVSTPLSGSYNVGTGGDFTSLTNAGGIFDTLNGVGATGNITINVTSDLTAETGTISLNQLPGGFTVLLQPSGGAARTISGTSGTALINLSGPDGVTINGLNTGGNSLLIRNTGTGATIRLIADASNNTIQNATIEGASTTAVVLISTGATTGNDNVAITGNTIRDRTDAAGVPVTLVQSAGTSAAVANSGLNISNNTLLNFTANGVLVSAGTENLTINGNDVSQTANRTTALFGISVSVSLGTNTISQNTVHGLRSSFAGGTFVNVAGIFLLDVRDGTVSRNRVYDFPALAGGTGRIVGIEFEGATGTVSAVTVANNMVSIVTSVATVQSVFGIFDFAFPTNTFNGFYNTVYIGGTSSGASNSWAINRGFDPTIHTLRNNIAYNNRTGGTGNHFAAGDQSAGSGTYSSNYNFFAGTGATTATNFMDRDTTLTGASTPVSFATWQAGPPARDANSIAGVASTFNPALFFVNTATGDLHLLATATQVLDAGTPVGTVTTDFDNDPRSATTPDIGADEFSAGGPGTLQFSAATYSIGEAGPTATITVTRTGGTTGIVGADYATVAGGTATGGGACGGAVDYVTTTGSVSFADGSSTPQTFNIPICNDSTDEADETVNLALSNPTGGATLGTQTTAVLTITDDDAGPNITITDVAAPEGNAGPTIFTFNVNLSVASAQTVTVHYQTADGTATTADNDYVAIPDTILTFNPGQTTLPVAVTVNGDMTGEPNQTFFVNLSTATNGTITDGQGQGTIQNDDGGVLPTLSIGNARLLEGDEGLSTMTFTVTLSGGPAEGVNAHYSTANGSAQAQVVGPEVPLVPHGNDYVPEQGNINNNLWRMSPEGNPTFLITISIVGDTFKEPNQFFTVTLDTPVGATIERGTGYGLIIDEERAYIGDLDHDRKTDLTVFRPSTQNWYTLSSLTGNPIYQYYGLAIDKPVPGDYDGDAIMDYAVRRPGQQNVWWVLYSSDLSLHSFTWGADSDISVQADYDADDKTDVAVFRNGVWFIRRSSDGATQIVNFGQPGDQPVPGEFDGDGRADLTVYRNGTWYSLQSSTNTMVTQQWGNASDRPVAGDFDGDGRYDFTVFRNGVWYILETVSGQLRAVFWGLAGDIPVVGDYDGDGTSDVAVFRPSQGNWYILRSSDNTVVGVQWGLSNDIPIPASYQP